VSTAISSTGKQNGQGKRLPTFVLSGSTCRYDVFIPIQIMAKTKAQTASTFQAKPKVSRPGVHSKTKSSKLKTSKLYSKSYRGQG
jgi:hypothetical protein